MLKRIFAAMLFLACVFAKETSCAAIKHAKTSVGSQVRVAVKSKGVRTNLDRQLKKRAAAQKKEHAKAYRSAILGKANSPVGSNR